MIPFGLTGERLLRAAFVLGALAALLVALSPLGELTEGRMRAHEDITTTLSVEPTVAVIGAIVFVLAVGAAFAPAQWSWVPPVGVLVITAAATTAGIELVRGRISETFVADRSTTLEGGGLMLTAGFWLAVLAIAGALVALRQIALALPPAPPEVREALQVRPDGRPMRSSLRATLGAALGVCGLLAPIFSGAAAALGVTALGDIRSKGGRLGGRGAAIGAIVLGIIGLSLMIAVLGVGNLVLQPGA